MPISNDGISICAYRAAIDAVWQLDKDAAIDRQTAQQARPLVAEFFRLCNKHGPYAGKYNYANYLETNRKRIEAILDAATESPDKSD